MAHVVASDLIGAVGKSLRVLVVARSQKQQCRGERAAGNDDDVGRINAPHDQPLRDVNALHDLAGLIGLQFRNIGASHQRQVRMRLQRRIDADDLGVRLAVQQAGKAVESIAADANAGRRRLAILFVQQDAERQMERVQTVLGQAVAQCLDRAVRAKPPERETAHSRAARLDPRRAVHGHETAAPLRHNRVRMRHTSAATPARRRPCG